ncbi:MAG: hypothetical protein WCK78_13685 [Paludibacter sp.]
MFDIIVNKSKLYGLIGSIISSLILLLCLWFLVLSVPKSAENEGFQVNFGDSYDAGGIGDGVPSLSTTKSANIEPAKKIIETSNKISVSKVFTQTENSVSISEKKEKNKIKSEQQDIILQNEINKRMIEQNQREQDAKNKAENLIGGTFAGNNASGNGKSGGDGTGKGFGSGNGNGIQGNPTGKSNSGVGLMINIGNRNYLGNPPKPNYPKDIEGKITVNIRVGENGVVTSTSIGSPTTISDAEMRRDAISAANKTRFSTGKGIETGSITYNYKLQ